MKILTRERKRMGAERARRKAARRGEAQATEVKEAERAKRKAARHDEAQAIDQKFLISSSRLEARTSKDGEIREEWSRPLRSEGCSPERAEDLNANERGARLGVKHAGVSMMEKYDEGWI